MVHDDIKTHGKGNFKVSDTSYDFRTTIRYFNSISNNLSLEMKKKLIKICIWCVAAYGSETRTVGKNEGRVRNAFETWSWRGMLKIKWTDRITNGEVLQRAKEEKILLKI